MPPKGKSDAAGYQRLLQDLSAGTPGRLYLFYGEETYLRDHYLTKLREMILTGGMGEFNLHEIPARDMSPRRLEEALDCLPMMAQRTLVQVTDYDLFKAGEKDREEYVRLLSDLPEYVCLVFVYDLIPYKGDARTKLAGAIKRSGTAVNFARQETGELVKWVRRRFRALGKNIDANLASELIFLCGDLMTNLIGEIEKIGAYAKGENITRGDIDAVATPQLDAVVFRMTDAIGEKNFDRAMSVLGELFQMQEAPIKILWSLGRQMRQLYSARLALAQGRGGAYVAGLWNLKPYPADKARLVLREMAELLSLDLVRKKLVTNQIVLTIGFDIENLTDPARRQLYTGPVVKDHYGRMIPKHAHGTERLETYTSSTKKIINVATTLFDKIVDANLLIRRINIVAGHVLPEDEVPSRSDDCEQLDMFTDYAAVQAQRQKEEDELNRERKVQEALLTIKKRFGKNAILKGMNLQEGATAKDRNEQIGGHKA